MSTAELALELAALNKAVTDAFEARQRWMDDHMPDFAKFKIGDEIYDLNTGVCLGKVTRLYRYWGGRDPRYDTSMNIEYEFHVRDGYHDNTSSRGGSVRFGTKEEAAREAQWKAERLRA